MIECIGDHKGEWQSDCAVDGGMLVESPGEYRARVRREQQHRSDQQRQDQQRREDQSRQERQRREDQSKRDEAERRRRSDELSRLAEEKRHNRALEDGRVRENFAGRVNVASSPKLMAAATYSEPKFASRRGGGVIKFIVLMALIWGAIHFWPEISGVARDALASTHSQPSGSAVDHATAQSEPEPNAPVASREVELIVAVKPAAKKYPRCSATITDQCQQDH